MNDERSKYLRIILIVEIQIVLALAIFLVYKIYDVDSKVKNTNQFVYRALVSKGITEANKIDEMDITIGDKNAPVTIIMYSKYSCLYCKEFFETTFLDLNEKYINKGFVKLVVRNLIPVNSKVAMFNAKCSQYAYNENVFLEFSKLMVDANHNITDTVATKNLLFSLVKNKNGFNAFVNSKSITQEISKKVTIAHEAGLFHTPSFLIGSQIVLGNRSLSKFEDLIFEEMKSASCE